MEKKQNFTNETTEKLLDKLLSTLTTMLKKDL